MYLSVHTVFLMKMQKITSPFVSVWSPTTALERALPCLTVLIGREVALPGWFERNRYNPPGYWNLMLCAPSCQAVSPVEEPEPLHVRTYQFKLKQ